MRPEVNEKIIFSNLRHRFISVQEKSNTRLKVDSTLLFRLQEWLVVATPSQQEVLREGEIKATHNRKAYYRSPKD